MKEFFSLLLLNLKVKALAVIEEVKVLYKYPSFTSWDMKLASYYLRSGAFAISKLFHLKRKDKEIYVYGETPLTSLAEITKQAELTSQDTFFDLGMGRGRGCLFVRKFAKCHVVGVEIIPEFIKHANQIKNFFNIERLDFVQADIVDADFVGGTVFYIYGNFLDDKTLQKIAKKFNDLPQGTKIITVSFPITDYTSKYEIIKCFPAHFPWGWGEVFICVRV